MGIFINKFLFREAEVDGQPVDDGATNQPQDYTEDMGGQNQNPPVNNQNPQQMENNNQQVDYNQLQQDVAGREPPPTDYTQMADDQMYGDDQGQGYDNPPPADNSETEVDDLKAQEEELYSNLSPEQLDIKHKELKTQFLNMYDLTTSIIEKIGDASVNEENIGTIEYISNQLSTLRTMLTDYINSVYKTKSYIENSINYNRFLAVLNGINKILEEMTKKQD